MVRYRFGTNDLLRTRFAIAPLVDLIGASYVLRYPEHRPWAEWALPRAQRLDLTLLHVVTPADADFYPVFVGPPPQAPRAAVEAELARIASTPPAVVAAELARAYPQGLPAAGRILVDDPRRGLAAGRRDAGALGRAAAALVEPHRRRAGGGDRLARAAAGGGRARRGVRGPPRPRRLEGSQPRRRGRDGAAGRHRPRGPRPAARPRRVHVRVAAQRAPVGSGARLRAAGHRRVVGARGRDGRRVLYERTEKGDTLCDAVR